MRPHMKEQNKRLVPTDISDADIYEAMKEIPGYLDITPGDLKEIYLHAYRHAFERISSSIKGSDMMTRQVLCVQKETPLSAVAEIMANNDVSGVPVVDPGQHVLGIISEKDFCTHMGVPGPKSLMGIIHHCLQNRGCLAVTLRQQSAGDIMTSPAVTVHEDTPLVEITSVLAKNNINRVPVVDRSDRLVGIVSRADIVRGLHQTPD